jgi:hypothetical protein
MSDEPTSGGTLGSALQSKRSKNADDAEARKAAGEDEEVKFNARVSESLRDEFQDVCESEGRSMSWVVREFMRRTVERGETGL